MRVGLLVTLTIIAGLGAAGWLALREDDEVSEIAPPREGPTEQEEPLDDGTGPGAATVAAGTAESEHVLDVVLLTGVVKNQNGEALPDAYVVLLRPKRSAVRTRTRNNGRFVLEGPPGALPVVQVGAKGHGARAFTSLTTGSDIVVVLEPAVAFSGVVTDAGDEPLGRVTVTATPRGRPDLARLTGETNSKGQFRLDTLAPGRWDVTVSKDGFAPFHDTGVVIGPPDGLIRDYVIDTGITLRGTVTTDRGQLVVGGVQIEVIDRIIAGRPIQNQSRRLGPYITKGDGTFEIPSLLPGTLVLLAKGRGFGATFQAHVIRKDAGSGPTVTIDLPRVAKFGGTVRDADGNPVRDALVVIVPDGIERDQFEHVSSFLFGAESWDDEAGARWPAVRTDRSGRWRVENAPDRAGGIVRAVDPQGRFAPSPRVRFNVARGDTSQIELRLARAVSVSGDVVDDRGLPVSGATLLMGGVRTITDERGAFAIRGVAAGKSHASLTHPGYLPFSEPIDIPEGGVDDLVLTMEQGATASGIVRDEHGDPVIGARVSAHPPAENGRGLSNIPLKVVTTGPDGAFLLGGFRAPVFDVAVRAEGFEIQRLVNVRSNVAPMDLVLDRLPWALGGDITGKLLDALTRQPITDGRIEDADHDRIVMLNDTFRILNEPAGERSLVISARNHQRRVLRDISVPSGETVDLGTIELFPCGKLEVTLRTKANKPYSKPARVRVEEKQNQGNPPWALVATRRGPVCTFPQLRPGVYELVIEAAGQRPVKRPVLMDRPRVRVIQKLK